MNNSIPTTAASVLNTLSRAAHTTAVEHGFYAAHSRSISALGRQDRMFEMVDDVERDFTLAQIAKIASECGEAVATIQHDDGQEALAEELADVIIRTLDLAAHLDVPIGDVLVAKMERNRARPYLHGKVC